MEDFVSIDFETGNPQRVSACSIGYAIVKNGNIIESNSYLIKPIGGHAAFQSKIHGITEKHTKDKPMFDEVYKEINDIFNLDLVGHSLFDKQVLNALSVHFGLNLKFTYTDSCALAKNKVPDLANYKLATIVKHFNLPDYKHHDAKEDAISCAKIMIKLIDLFGTNNANEKPDEKAELLGMIKGILADNEVNYKEAYELLYWLEDHKELSHQYSRLYKKLVDACADDVLDCEEAIELKKILRNISI